MKKLKYKSTNDHTNAIQYLKSTEFVKVKTKYSKGTDWTALSLIGYSKDPRDILKPNVLQKQNDTLSKAVVPIVKTDLFFKSELDSISQIIDDLNRMFYLKFQRVRLMKLNAHTKIDKHTDKIDKEFLKSTKRHLRLLRLHLPIKTNDKVSFSIWNGKSKESKILKTNQLYLVDVTKPHSVVNNSNEDRIHLVLDCYDYHNTFLGNTPLFAPTMKETVKWFNQKVSS